MVKRNILHLQEMIIHSLQNKGITMPNSQPINKQRRNENER